MLDVDNGYNGSIFLMYWSLITKKRSSLDLLSNKKSTKYIVFIYLSIYLDR